MTSMAVSGFKMEKSIRIFENVAMPTVYNVCTPHSLMKMCVIISIYLRSIPLGWQLLKKCKLTRLKTRLERCLERGSKITSYEKVRGDILKVN